MHGVSAIVATVDRTNELKRLLDSFLENDNRELEVIIVDQNENGLLADLLDNYKGKLDINHLRQAEKNQSKARNYGAQHAKYPVVCFPDDDCWFDGGVVQTVKSHFEKKKELDLLIINWKQNPYEHPRSFVPGKKDLQSFRGVGYVTYVLFFKKEAFFSLGAFCEEIGIGQYIGGGEDSEIAFRAMSQNLNIYYDATATVNHFYTPVTRRDYPLIRARQRAMGMIYVRYRLPFFIILRGFLSPLVKMLSLNRKKAKVQFNMLKGRWEGFLYERKRKKLSARRSAEITEPL